MLQRLCNMKALLGILAGAGASYGLYKLLLSMCGDTNVKRKRRKDEESVKIQAGTLLSKVSSFNVVTDSVAMNLTTGRTAGKQDKRG